MDILQRKNVDRKIDLHPFIYAKKYYYNTIESSDQLPRAHMEEVIMNKNGDL
jgi:hypothetical protein